MHDCYANGLIQAFGVRGAELGVLAAFSAAASAAVAGTLAAGFGGEAAWLGFAESSCDGRNFGSDSATGSSRKRDVNR